MCTLASVTMQQRGMVFPYIPLKTRELSSRFRYVTIASNSVNSCEFIKIVFWKHCNMKFISLKLIPSLWTPYISM